MSEPADTTAPWTIKSCPTATREAVIVAARKEGLTVGQWLERRVREWTEDGGPVPVSVPTTAAPGAIPNMGELAQAMQAARALAEAAGVPVPPQLAKDAFSTVRLAMRQARGLPPARPRQPSPMRIEGPDARMNGQAAAHADES